MKNVIPPLQNKVKLNGETVERLIEDYFNAWPNMNQKVGCGVDMLIHDYEGNPFLCEVKYDAASEKTNNFYLEIAQTFNNKKNWQLSGVSLALEQSELIIFCQPNGIAYTVTSSDLIELLTSNTFKRVDTRTGINGNRGGSYSTGYLVPVSKIKKLSCYTFNYLPLNYSKAN